MENELSFKASGNWQQKVETAKQQISQLKSTVSVPNAWGWYHNGEKIIVYITDECTDSNLQKEIIAIAKAVFA